MPQPAASESPADSPTASESQSQPDATAQAPSIRGLTTPLLITLGVLSAAAPMSTDLYLSALPAMATALHSTTTGVQLSLTGFLIGSAAGQVVFGPWSDRKGRMLPLLFGLGLFVAASVVSAAAPTLAVLLIARLLQGIGASAGMVISRAIVLDRAQGLAAARALNVMVMIGGIAPIIAPLFGSLLAGAVGWRGLLSIVAGVAVLSLLLTLVLVRESLPAGVRAQRRAQRASGGSSGTAKAITGRHFVGNLLAFGFAMGVLMSYISASPFIYQDLMGLGQIPYGLAFAVNAIGMLVSNLVSNKLAGRLGLRTITTGFQLVSAVGIVSVVVLGLIGTTGVALMIALFLAVAPIGAVLGNSTAIAMAEVPARATGMASALLGMLQFLVAGVMAGIVGLGGNPVLWLGMLMVGSLIVSVAGLQAARHAQGEPDPGALDESPAKREVVE